MSAAALSLLLLNVGAAPAAGADHIEFNAQIRPVLAENCFVCHGPDKGSRKADLRLDQRQAAIDAGAIAPGKPDESMLVERIFADDPAERMPPPAAHKALTAPQKELLRRWIAAGAEYQPHWALIAPKRPALPGVKDERWVRTPIDRFILAKLEKEGLTPAAEADRATLARRAALDVTGLPPDGADLAAFLADRRPDAWSRYLDRLFASSHWGEHRARYWLDAARYADTHGIHFDNFREMWTYRDWVIHAFQKNQPFDQFTIEQLAGDLLPNRTLEQQIASGFNRCNITTNEGGVIGEEYLVLYTRDRTETAAQVWMGLTAGCAVCHDHKYDPLTQKEFYELSAFFNNTTQAAMDGNIKDTPPVVVVTAPEERAEWERLTKEQGEKQRALDHRKQGAKAEFDQWLGQPHGDVFAGRIPAEGLYLHAQLDEGQGATLSLSVDGKRQVITGKKAWGWKVGPMGAPVWATSEGEPPRLAGAGDFDRTTPFSCSAWVRLEKQKVSGAIVARMDDRHGYRGWDFWLEDGKPGLHLIHVWQEDAIKVVANQALKPGQWHHLALSYDGSAKAAGVKLYVDAQLQPVKVMADRLKGTIRTDAPLTLGQRAYSSTIKGLGLADLRIYRRAVSADDSRRLFQYSRAAWLGSRPVEKLSKPEREQLFIAWLEGIDSAYQGLKKPLEAVAARQAVLKARSTVAYVTEERAAPPEAYILFRGQYDQRREKLSPGTPAFLPPMPKELPRNRLGLAQWLLRPEHPLTARVTVNRLWQEVFGAGLVGTTGDFGVNGEMPSHPELLDWLAVEFRESGWDVKRFFRLLLESATYRQIAAATPAKLEKDPQNRLLSRGPRFRMDAEMVRDYALAASGLLVPKIGGPSVKPYQPDGVWEAVAMIGSNTHDYRRDSGENLYRRSLYTFWKRAAPPALMEIFNAPTREVCTVHRERTNTPLQALATLNDPQFVEAARHLAGRAIREAGTSDAARLDFAAVRLLARPLSEAERKPLLEMATSLRSHYEKHRAEADELITVGESKPPEGIDRPLLATWTMIVNTLMNLDEALNK